MNADEQARQRMIEERNREHLRLIRLEQAKARNRKAQKNLKDWAERTPERAA